MRKFLNKWFSMINKRDLVTSVTASIIVLGMIACGSGNVNNIGNGGGGNIITHLISLPFSGHRIVPASGSKFVASAFATISTASQLAQSYDVQCTVTQGVANTTFVLMEIPSTQSGNCSNAGSVTDETINTFSGTNPASKATVTDGTLTSLVVTGRTVGNQRFQCRDLANGFAILDNSNTAAFLDTVAHTVKVFNQAPNGTITQAPFVCNGIGTDTDPVNVIEVQWVKQ